MASIVGVGHGGWRCRARKWSRRRGRDDPRRTTMAGTPRRGARDTLGAGMRFSGSKRALAGLAVGIDRSRPGDSHAGWRGRQGSGRCDQLEEHLADRDQPRADKRYFTKKKANARSTPRSPRIPFSRPRPLTTPRSQRRWPTTTPRRSPTRTTTPKPSPTRSTRRIRRPSGGPSVSTTSPRQRASWASQTSRTA